MDFISIIIPAFNADRWLERTLKSVSATIDADCEVIIVNDGSVDETHNIAEKYAEDDPRFVVIDIEHAGPNAARKAGFLESQGDYIMFVDSDDLLAENSIAELRKARQGWRDVNDDNPEHTTTDDVPKIIIGNTLERRGNEDHLLIAGSRRALTGIEYACGILDRSIYGFLPGHLYSRDLLEAIDWDDSPLITHHDNFYLLLSMAMKLNEWAPEKRLILVVPSVVAYIYLRRPGSQSGLMSLTPKGLERVMQHVQALGLPEPYFTIWGLEVIKSTFVDRGIPFPNDYVVAERFRKSALALGDEIPEHLHELVDALGSEKKRTRIAAELARTAGWTMMSPHLSIIIVCGHNIKKVQKTVQSIFDTGFRNLEVILVELDNTHSELVALNEISIKFPRVRIIKAEPGDNRYVAAGRGLDVCEGLSVTFMRPGDLLNARGIYEAVTRIDYGADVVMANYRRFNPLTHVHGRIYSFCHLRSTEASRNAEHTAANTTENVYNAVFDAIKNPDPKNPLFLFGLVWRTDFLKEKKLHDADYEISEINATFSYVFLKHLMHEPLRVVTQDRTTPHAFELAESGLFKKILPGL